MLTGSLPGARSYRRFRQFLTERQRTSRRFIPGTLAARCDTRTESCAVSPRSGNSGRTRRVRGWRQAQPITRKQTSARSAAALPGFALHKCGAARHCARLRLIGPAIGEQPVDEGRRRQGTARAMSAGWRRRPTPSSAWSGWVSRSSVESGAGDGACFTDAAYAAAGAAIAADAADRARPMPISSSRSSGR